MEPQESDLRESILTYLQHMVNKIISDAIMNKSGIKDNNVWIMMLLDAIERIFNNGLIKSAKYDYFDVINLALNQNEKFQKNFKVLRNLPDRGKIFICWALNNKIISESVSILIENEKILQKYYQPDSILLREDNYEIFLAQLNALNSVSFVLTVPKELDRFLTITPETITKSPVVVETNKPEPIVVDDKKKEEKEEKSSRNIRIYFKIR